MILCPKCKFENKDENKNCKKCDYNLENIYICPNCNKTFKKEKKFCDNCHFSLMAIKDFKQIKNEIKKAKAYNEYYNIEKSLENTNKGLSKFPNNEMLIYQKALALESLKEYEDSLKYYNLILKNNPNHVDAIVGKSYVYHNQDIDKAIKYLNKNLKYDFDGDISECKIRFLMSLNKFEECTEFIKKAYKKFPNNESLYHIYQLFIPSDIEIKKIKNINDVLIRNKNIKWDDNNSKKLMEYNYFYDIFEYINRVFKKTIETDNINELNAKGSFFNGFEFNDYALNFFNKAYEVDPNNSTTNFYQYMLNKRNNKDYEVYMNNCLNLKDENVEILINKAIIYNEEFNSEKALECCEKIIEIDSDNRDVLFLKGKIYLKINELDTAYEYYNNFTILYPNDEKCKKIEEIKYNIACELEDNTKIKKQEKILSKIYNRSNKADNLFKSYIEKKENIDYLNQLDRINQYKKCNRIDNLLFLNFNENKYNKKSKLGKFMNLMQNDKDDIKLIKIDDRFKNEKDNLEKIIIYIHDNKNKKALKLINKLIEKNDKNIDFYGIKSKILLNLGRKNQAIDCMNTIIEYDPDFKFTRELRNLYVSKYCKTIYINNKDNNKYN